MNRRRFIAGVGGVTTGGSVLVGSGAFSRVESQRTVTIQTAHDRDAYVELNETGSSNSQNFVRFDDNGHIVIEVQFGGQDADGANSDSHSWWDNLFKICNRGKADATAYVADTEGVGMGDGEIAFYTGEASGSDGDDGIESIVGQDNEQDVPLGECLNIGLRSNSKDVSAPETLFDDHVTIVADSTGAGDEDHDG